MEGVASEAASLRRAPAAGQADRPLRRQPHHHRRRHRSGLHRGRRRALRGVRLARAGGRRRQRPGRCRRRHRGGAGRDRIARRSSRCAPTSGSVQPDQAGHHQGPRRAARRRRAGAHQRAPGVADSNRRSCVPEDVQVLLEAAGARGAAAHAAWRERHAAWSAADPGARRRAGPRPGAARCPRAGTPICRSSRRRMAVWRRAPRRGRSSTPWRQICRTSSAARPTWRPPTTPGSRATATSQAATPAGRNLHFGVREHAMGGDRQRHGAARRPAAVRRHVPRLHRLHAPGRSASRR